MGLRYLSSTLLALLVSAPLAAAPATYRIDPEHFSIAFLIEHIGYERLIGQFTQASGEFVYDEQVKQLRSGSVEVRAASVTTHHERRDAHVRSGDFLDAEKHPSHPIYRDGVSIQRPFWQRGRRHPARQSHDAPPDASGRAQGPAEQSGSSIPSVIANTRSEFRRAATVQRSRWGMSYGVANGMVGDEVELMFEFEALRQ